MFKTEKGFGDSLAKWAVAGRHTNCWVQQLELAGEGGVRCWNEGQPKSYIREGQLYRANDLVQRILRKPAIEGQDFYPLRLAGWEQELCLGCRRQERGMRSPRMAPEPGWEKRGWGWARISIKAGDRRLATEKYKPVRQERPLYASQNSSLGCFSRPRCRSKAQNYTFAGCKLWLLQAENAAKKDISVSGGQLKGRHK